MDNFLKKIGRDIKERKNLELYLVLLTAFIVIIVSTFGLDTSSAINEILLAVLALLTFGMIEDRSDVEKIGKQIQSLKLGQNSESFFSEWDDTPFRQRLANAKEVSLLSIANHVFISRNSGPIKRFIEKGGTLRCILVDPASNAMKMACDLSTGYEKQIENLSSQVNLSIDNIRDFHRLSSESQKVQIKLIDHLPFAVVTMIDHSFDDGVMYVTLNGFEESASIRPSFVLNKENDEKWFSFYQRSFENIWNCSKCEMFDLENDKCPSIVPT